MNDVFIRNDILDAIEDHMLIIRINIQMLGAKFPFNNPQTDQKISISAKKKYSKSIL